MLLWLIGAAVAVALFAVAWVTSGPRFQGRSRPMASRRGYASGTEQDALLASQSRQSQANSQGGYLG